MLLGRRGPASPPQAVGRRHVINQMGPSHGSTWGTEGREAGGQRSRVRVEGLVRTGGCGGGEGGRVLLTDVRGSPRWQRPGNKRRSGGRAPTWPGEFPWRPGPEPLEKTLGPSGSDRRGVRPGAGLAETWGSGHRPPPFRESVTGKRWGTVGPRPRGCREEDEEGHAGPAQGTVPGVWRASPTLTVVCGGGSPGQPHPPSEPRGPCSHAAALGGGLCSPLFRAKVALCV